MAYTKNTWVTGDIVTSEKLNHMEDGIANASWLVAHDNDNVLDKTWQEIADAFPFVLILDSGRGLSSFVTYVEGSETDPYTVIVIGFRVGEITYTAYTAETSNGYPSIKSTN